MQKSLDQAEKLDSNGSWFLAAECYAAVGESAKNDFKMYLETAKIFARAATCFELAVQKRDAARAYFEAASILHNNRINCQVAGELFNRAAFNFKSISEFFNAGDSYRRAAIAFADSQDSTIHTDDNIPPVPMGAGKFTVSADCFNAAAEAFVEGKKLALARASYWEAGKMHWRQGHGYHAYVAFRKALVTCIQFDHTHDGKQLRSALPMSEEERKKKADPIQILEQTAYDGNLSHQQINVGLLDETWVKRSTDEQMITAFHEFYLELLKVGNLKEARNYYYNERRRQRILFFRQKRFLAWSGFWMWEAICGYGESFTRWFCVCSGMLFVFSMAYTIFDLIEPVTSWVDYPYFSVITFTTLGYGDIHPYGTIGKIVASLEAVLGLLMLGMLLTFLNRRIFR